MTHVVNIGKNYEMSGLRKSLTAVEWSFFKNDITSLFEQIHFFGEGIGYCGQNDNPISEISYVVIGIPKNCETIFDKLKELAIEYKQDEIAITNGTTRFVKANDN